FISFYFCSTRRSSDLLLLFFCNRLIAFTEECFQSVSVQLLLYISLSVITAALLYFIEDINALLGLAVLLSLLSFYLIWSFTLHNKERTRLIGFYQQLKKKVFGKKSYV